jgi:hypothetical protein
MPFYPGHGVGLRNVGSYQISGHPYMTGSLLATDQEYQVTFPFVAKSVTVIASGSNSNIRVHFASSSAGNVMGGKHYISLNSSEDSVTFNHKCKEIYITSIVGGEDKGFELFASLTGISTDHMYELTGTGLTE